MPKAVLTDEVLRQAVDRMWNEQFDPEYWKRMAEEEEATLWWKALEYLVCNLSGYGTEAQDANKA